MESIISAPDGDLDRDLLAMPVIPNLQLECIEELPLKLPWEIENVQASYRGRAIRS